MSDPTPRTDRAVHAEPKRVLGIWSASALVVGLIIGSGIFRAPSSVAAELPSTYMMLLAWTIGGVLSLCGALAVSDLGTRYPTTGGLYIFMRESFGAPTAVGFGWSGFLVSRPAVLAGVATVFAEYLCPMVGLPTGWESTRWVASAAVVALTVVNALGLRAGAGVQNVFTFAKVLGLALLITAVGLFGRGELHAAQAIQPAHSLPVAMLLALITILYTYDGWIDVTYAGGEVRDPRRNLPRAIVLGTLGCMALYLLTNFAYCAVLTPAEIAAAPNVAAVALERVFGMAGREVLTVLVLVSTLGILNGSILTGTRLPFALARDGFLPARLGTLAKSTGSPVWSLTVQGLMTVVVLVFVNGFDNIAALFVVTSWLAYAVAIAGLLVIRARERRAGAPAGESFRMPLGPWPALIFIVVTMAIIVQDVISSGVSHLAGVAVVAVGAVVAGLRLRR
ncbi:MAG: amino acid permease [Candidatus Eisenbacteria bacterium]|nr:amino acid permease [Candidatus Eisenbacteria bacterium]